MSLKVGIVGLPNVGKSTLFNALLRKQQALVASYPFTTVSPNVGIVPVPDERLEKLAALVRASTDSLPQIVPTIVRFVDIAGLVKDAHKGAGLGNAFLSHIREVDVIAHVLRVFEDENVSHGGKIDPPDDYHTVQTELILSDLAMLEKSEEKRKNETIQKLASGLARGFPARSTPLTIEEREVANSLPLLTRKEELVVLNVSEADFAHHKLIDLAKVHASFLGLPVERFVVICAKLEQDMAGFLEEERKKYLQGLGLAESGVEQFIRKAHETLGLITFYTVKGGKEVRAWSLRRGDTVLSAAEVVHTDFAKHFIKAEVIGVGELLVCGGWHKAKEAGKVSLEGRDYTVSDGDVIEFKVGV